jgi:hypothetical protein
MPIFEVDDEFLNTLDDSVKSSLKPYEPEDVTGLKNKANQLLAENKSYKAKLAEFETSISAQSKDSGSGSEAEKLRKMLEDSEKQRQAKEDEIKAIQESMRRGKVRSEAEKLAAQATTDPKKAAMLAERYERQLNLDGDNLIVLDANGNPTVSKLEELASIMRTEYPFLFDGSKAAGGGANGSNGGAVTSQSSITRQKFDSMDIRQRAEFIKNGGKIKD